MFQIESSWCRDTEGGQLFWSQEQWAARWLQWRLRADSRVAGGAGGAKWWPFVRTLSEMGVMAGV